jgi:putative endonuclease
MERRFFVYILANKPYGTLYTGVTSDIEARVYQHKNGVFEGFTKKYGIKTLVCFEEHATVLTAIHREKRIKKWPCEWKINLVRNQNPHWDDLAAHWYPEMPTKEEIEVWLARIAKIEDGDE